MNFYLEMAICFVASYIISFLAYVLFINNGGKKKSKKKLFKKSEKEELLDKEIEKRSSEVTYLIRRFHLSNDRENENRIRKILNFINPLIISITFVVIINIKSFMLGIIVGFVVMMALVYAVYEILGRILKKGEDKNV